MKKIPAAGRLCMMQRTRKKSLNVCQRILKTVNFLLVKQWQIHKEEMLSEEATTSCLPATMKWHFTSRIKDSCNTLSVMPTKLESGQQVINLSSKYQCQKDGTRNAITYLIALWTALPTALEVCSELVKCSCKTAAGCTGKCSCKKSPVEMYRPLQVQLHGGLDISFIIDLINSKDLRQSFCSRTEH